MKTRKRGDRGASGIRPQVTSSPYIASERTGTAVAAVVSIVLVAASYLVFGQVSLNIADEGYLWYGVLRTAAGEVPLRDFQSYEPGRYYWGAVWSMGLGEGILALRLSTAIFQTLGLFCGLLVARRLVSHPAWLLPLGLVLILWMFPRHKLFESSLAMMAVYAGLRLLETRSRLGLFSAGAFVGLASFFGRNHALYAGLGVLLLTLWLHWKWPEGGLFNRLAVLAGGVVVGALPLLGMILFVPGFGASFLESVRFLLKHGSNLPLPFPWPWRADYAVLNWSERMARFALGTSFLLAPLVYGLGLLSMLHTGAEQLRQRSVLIAATAVGVFYFHHASVRSDATHLAQCIHPLLLAGLAIPGSFGPLRGRLPRLTIWIGIALLAVLIAPVYDKAFLLPWQAQTKRMVPRRIAGDELWLSPHTAHYLDRVERVVQRWVPKQESMLIAPYMVTLYPVLGKTSPIWGLYLSLKASADEEAEIIDSLERRRVNWALIVDRRLDGKEALRFRNTHARVWEYLTKEFDLVRAPELPPDHALLRRRSPMPLLKSR